MTNILEVNAIHTFINQFHILEGVSLDGARGQHHGAPGPQRRRQDHHAALDHGPEPPREGQIIFAGEEIQGKTAYEIAARGIGYVPEYRAIFRALTVEENLKIAERSKGDLARRGDLDFRAIPRPQTLLSPARRPALRRPAADARHCPGAGARKPAACWSTSRARGWRPIIIEAIVAALRQLAAHATVLLVEQNFRMASQLADRYYIVDDGQTVTSGQMADLVNDRPLITKYLGAGYAGARSRACPPKE